MRQRKRAPTGRSFFFALLLFCPGQGHAEQLLLLFRQLAAELTLRVGPGHGPIGKGIAQTVRRLGQFGGGIRQIQLSALRPAIAGERGAAAGEQGEQLLLVHPGENGRHHIVHGDAGLLHGRVVFLTGEALLLRGGIDALHRRRVQRRGIGIQRRADGVAVVAEGIGAVLGHGEDQLQRHLRCAVRRGQAQCLLRRRVHAVSHIDRTRPGARQPLCLDPAAAGRQ